MSGTSLDFGALRSFFASLTLQRLVPALVIAAVGFFAIKGFMKLFNRILSRSKIDPTIHGFLRAAFRVLLTAIVVLMVVSSLGLDATSLIAVLSVASLAVSLAVQGALSNIAGGLMILTTHPFRVSDWVEIAGISGTVSEIGTSYTKLVTGDRKEIFVPNSEISATKIINYTMAGSRRVDLTFSASYDDDIETVKAALRKAADLPQVLAEPAPFFSVSSYGDSAISYIVRVWTASGDYWDVYYAITENVKACFDEAGISMTYPHLNVHLDAPKS